VRGRILIGVSAWLLGAGAATGGSMLAVSLIGQGMSGFSSQQITGAAVDRAVTSESGDSSASVSPSSVATSQLARRPTTKPQPSAPAVASPSAAPGTAPAPSTPAPASSAPTSTVLTSQGGNVVAACQQAGAYLISWIPQQGYEVRDVMRGPAATTRVLFVSNANSVTMVVTCTAGVPTGNSYIHSGGGATTDE
jgi:serine/threonine-protein kinase